MKLTTLLFVLPLLGLSLVACDQKTVKNSSSTNTNAYCTQYPYAYGCPGYTGNTTSGTTAGTTSGTTTGTTGGSSGGPVTGNCNPYYGQIDYRCSNYCNQSPRPQACLANGTNCLVTPNAAGCPGNSTSVSTSYGDLYPTPPGVPSGNCSAAYVSSGSFETRKATMTMPGKQMYTPTLPRYLSTSDILTSVVTAKTLFMTDSILKMRVKVNAQPKTAQSGAEICAGRNLGENSFPLGYTKLSFSVYLRSVTSSNGLDKNLYIGNYTIGVNSCTPAIDLSYYKAQYPEGLVVTISDVMGDRCWNPGGCSQMAAIREFDCWSMDLEVAADGTKTFN